MIKSSTPLSINEKKGLLTSTVNIYLLLVLAVAAPITIGIRIVSLGNRAGLAGLIDNRYVFEIIHGAS